MRRSRRVPPVPPEGPTRSCPGESLVVMCVRESRACHSDETRLGCSRSVQGVRTPSSGSSLPGDDEESLASCSGGQFSVPLGEIQCTAVFHAVSYTHLTLPTILRV